MRTRGQFGRWAMLPVVVVAACAGAQPPSVDVLFEAGTVYDTGSNATGIAAADFDGDGDVDLATASRGTSDVSILFNNGDGTFASGGAVPVQDDPRYVVTGDFDGDGDPDLATAGGAGSVSVLLNDGTGVFTVDAIIPFPEPTWLIAGDLDRDGDLDLYVTWIIPGGVSGRLGTLTNDGSGNFTETDAVPTGSFPRGGAIADIDDDDDEDLLIANLLSSTVSVLRNDGNGVLINSSIVITGPEPRYLDLADFNGDGRPDLSVVRKSANEVRVFANDGTGTFSALGDYPTHNSPHSVVATDVDGDGDQDFAVSHVGASFVDIFINDGTGIFVDTTIASPFGPAHVIAADLDGDGHDDFATANTNNGSTTVHLNRTPSAGARTVLRVDAAAAPGGDGTTWPLAIRDPQDAFDAALTATAPVAVWIADGTYVPQRIPAGVTGADDRDFTFGVPAGVRVYGHFDGGEISIYARPPADAGVRTIWSGDVLGDDDASEASRADNLFHVVVADLSRGGLPGETDALLDGLIVRGGNAESGDGGGVLAEIPSGATLRIVDLDIEDSRAAQGGGMLADGAGTVMLERVRFADNIGFVGGGGFYGSIASGGALEVSIRDSVFIANEAPAGPGGGLFVFGSERLSLSAVEFVDNQALFGGGLRVDVPTDLVDVVLRDNTAFLRGGGMVVFADVNAFNVEMRGNVAEDGGGLYVMGGNNVTVANGLFTGNTAIGSGGAIFVDAGTLRLIGGTVTENTAPAGGGIAVEATATIDNTIVWANPGGAIDDVSGGAIVRHSIVEGGWTGAGSDNFDADPRFVDAAGGDFTLRSISPGISAGDASFLPDDLLDLDGDGNASEDLPIDLAGSNRVNGPQIDLGAYETDFCIGDVDASGDVGFTDLLAVLSAWGPCARCPEDLNGSGAVSFEDLLMVLSAWGACP